VFLKVDEGSGELNESFVKRIIWAVSFREPKIFEDVVSLEEELVVEALEVSEVASVELPAFELFEQGIDTGGLFSHGTRIGRGDECQKVKNV
jgi:hypothetical protein